MHLIHAITNTFFHTHTSVHTCTNTHTRLLVFVTEQPYTHVPRTQGQTQIRTHTHVHRKHSCPSSVLSSTITPIVMTQDSPGLCRGKSMTSVRELGVDPMVTIEVKCLVL